MKNKFINGLKLGELYYKKIIKPILFENFSDLKYSAGLIGEGSEILGYDDVTSTDHCWGPRIMIFLSDEDYKNSYKSILDTIMSKIPKEFMGYSTELHCAIKKTTVDIFTIKSYFIKHLTISPEKNLAIEDWLIFPSQKLLETTSGKLFHDGLDLQKIIKKFDYYPKDVWLYILSCQWTKIGQEEPFMGRCGHSGDELGSQIIASRLVREIMKLCFLMEKKYAPYSKWFGRGFCELKISKKISPILRKVLLSKNWKEREKWLSKAYKILVECHNSLKITPLISTKVTNFHERPYLVIHSDDIAESIKKAIKEPSIRHVQTNIGSVDQFIDSTDVLSFPEIIEKIKNVFIIKTS